MLEIYLFPEHNHHKLYLQGLVLKLERKQDVILNLFNLGRFYWSQFLSQLCARKRITSLALLHVSWSKAFVSVSMTAICLKHKDPSSHLNAMNVSHQLFEKSGALLHWNACANITCTRVIDFFTLPSYETYHSQSWEPTARFLGLLQRRPCYSVNVVCIRPTNTSKC